MKIPVLDNGGQWTHREWRVLRDLGAESRILPNTASAAELDADGIVLSGGALSLEGSAAPLGRVDEWIDTVEVPVLGICVGHHYLARHFGGRVEKAGAPEFGRVQVTIDDRHQILDGLDSPFTAWASHNDQVTQLPKGWRRLAHSPDCPAQVIVHPSRPVYGIQFHPEVEHTQGGRRIFQNFLDLCRR